MRVSRTAFATIVASLLLAPILQGCAGREDRTNELRAIIARTVSQSRHYRYSEAYAGHTAVVEASIQDDLRYKTSYSRDGHLLSEEVIVDDARALRIPDPAAADRVAPSIAVTRPGLGSVGAGASPTGTASQASTIGLPAPEAAGAAAESRPGAQTLDLIHSGGWVLDAAGAGRLQRKHTAKREELGDDQVRDALNALRYVDDSMTQLGGTGAVVLYNPEAINYRADLDPFPRPKTAAGELRYDLRQPGLAPRAGGAGTSEAQREQGLPGPAYFRSLSVYVRRGLVERVVESVSVERALKNPDQDLLARIQDAGTQVPASVKTGAPSVQAAFIARTLIAQQLRRNQSPLRVHELQLVVSGLGAAQDVTLPDGAAKASLAGVLPRGLVLDQG
ncbi:MAG: hypothetical protein ABR573_03015 [Candidatus Dormibacteria bacterium]